MTTFFKKTIYKTQVSANSENEHFYMKNNLSMNLYHIYAYFSKTSEIQKFPYFKRNITNINFYYNIKKR